MTQNITFNLGDNKDASVDVQTIPKVRLKIKLDFESIDYNHQTININFCFYANDMYHEITYLKRPIYGTYPTDISNINNLILGMKNKLNVKGKINWITEDMYWIQSLSRKYQDPYDGGWAKFKIKLCEESQEQFIDELRGLIHILNTINNKANIVALFSPTPHYNTQEYFMSF